MITFVTYQHHGRIEIYFQPTVFLIGVSFEGPLIAIHLGPLTIEVWKFWRLS